MLYLSLYKLKNKKNKFFDVWELNLQVSYNGHYF